MSPAILICFLNYYSREIQTKNVFNERAQEDKGGNSSLYINMLCRDIPCSAAVVKTKIGQNMEFLGFEKLHHLVNQFHYKTTYKTEQWKLLLEQSVEKKSYS